MNLGILSIAIGAVAVGYALYRQFTPTPVSASRLVIIPLLLAFFAVQSFGKPGTVIGAAAIGMTFVGVLTAIGLGLWRGVSMKIWFRGGAIVAQGTWLTAGIWALTIVSRIVLSVAAGHLVGGSESVLTGEALAGAAVTFGAQNLVVWMRSQAAVAVAA